MLLARELKKEDKEIYLEFVNEVRNYDNNFEGFKVGNTDNYEELLEKLNKSKSKDNLKNNISPQITYGFFDDDELIGIFSLRLNLVGILINHGGNIGYFIRPSKRKIGYGTKLLQLALLEAKKYGLKKVLITCRKENIASSKVIENNGGILENIYFDKEKNEQIKRYWIIIESNRL